MRYLVLWLIALGLLAACAPRAAAPPPSSTVRIYVVQSGDSLYGIARRYGVDVDELRAFNGLEGNLIHAGQRLRIPPAQTASAAPIGYTETGLASWYGPKFHGRRTASGEVFDMHAFTAAHRSLPFGSLVRVTRLDTCAEVVVRINDRGPFTKERILDLSYAAALKLDLVRAGTARVRIEVIGFEN